MKRNKQQYICSLEWDSFGNWLHAMKSYEKACKLLINPIQSCIAFLYPFSGGTEMHHRAVRG